MYKSLSGELMFSKEEIAERINRIREDNGFPTVPFVIDEVRYDEEEDKLFIIAKDRSDKSAIIGNSLSLIHI